ncbi:DEAD/DEAH box helicase family protein [Bacteroides ihuae]|uniref:hypothetical protein n=1 Tax=Bacteroides ihuae TaxID=1852362 RepID=UPI0008DAD8E4|nr:hypothetical protein [Bacteroides ihuae]
MNYIELINQFWSIRRYKPMTAHEADFYFFLLKECNMRNWLCPFDLPTRLIQAELGYSNKVITDLRNRLKQKGLIDFIEGNRRERAAAYILVSVSNQNSNQTSNQFSNQNGNQIGNPLNTKHKQKQKQENNSNELFAQSEIKPPKIKRPKKEFIPPTLEEVKGYFAGKLPEWEQQAEIFFNHFESLGWKAGNGVKIQRWDSRANLWIIEKSTKNGNKKQANDDLGTDVIIRSTTA